MKNHTHTIKNPYIKRNIFPTLKKWLDAKEVLALTGPRQSGKTTLLKHLQEHLINEKNIPKESIISVTFEDREQLRQFEQDPKEYVRSFVSKKARLYFFIDEFQYARQGGQKLKLVYDLFPQVKFVITGSSSLELKDATGKYMVGRMISFNVWQLNFSEFLRYRAPQNLYRAYQEKHNRVKNVMQGNAITPPQKDIFIHEINKYLHEFILYGGYPRVVLEPSPESKHVILKNIYDTYVTKDIIQLLQLSDYDKLNTLAMILASQIGNMVNLTAISQESGYYYKELMHHLTILEETYILKRIRPYYKNIRTELKKSRKVYFQDTGLRNHIIQGFSNLTVRTDKGPLIENFVYTASHTYENFKVNFWRTTGKAEVDFIMQKGEKLIPIEVKYSTFRKPNLPLALRNVTTTYTPKNAIVLTRDFWGETKVENTVIYFVPAAYF